MINKLITRFNYFTATSAGIYLGIIAFFVAGMVYDTSVNVMPLIYGLLGMGISCNYCVVVENSSYDSTFPGCEGHYMPTINTKHFCFHS